MSTRETILAAIATALAGVAGGRVYRSRREQLPELPAVVIKPAGEEGEERVLGFMDRRLKVGISVHAQGDPPDAAADAELAAAWAALSASLDLGLGGNVQIEQGHEVAWEFEDFDHGLAVLMITVNYRTPTGSM